MSTKLSTILPLALGATAAIAAPFTFGTSLAAEAPALGIGLGNAAADVGLTGIGSSILGAATAPTGTLATIGSLGSSLGASGIGSALTGISGAGSGLSKILAGLTNPAGAIAQQIAPPSTAPPDFSLLSSALSGSSQPTGLGGSLTGSPTGGGSGSGTVFNSLGSGGPSGFSGGGGSSFGTLGGGDNNMLAMIIQQLISGGQNV